MATDASSQRTYRAACPNCGAPVEFRSAASAFAVCGFCRSTIVREADALRKIGESAELFEDHSPLRLGASGKYQGAPFTLVGRLQYRYAEGTWNEWHALFDGGPEGGKSGWLSEDNGRYVIAFDLPFDGAPGSAPPPAENLAAGGRLSVASEAWSIASVTAAKLIAAQGELLVKPQLEHGFVVADLRNSRAEVGTLDYSEPAAPRWSVGRSVALSDLAMTGLAEAAEKALKGRATPCPNCGAPLGITLASTRSIACRQCKSVVDVSQGVGGDMAHYAQENGSEPQLPLGTVGRLAFGNRPALPWQVVGYVERCTVPGGTDDDDSQSFWREYLLYHRTEGFTFIVDAEDGWSWSAPITGVPEAFGASVKHEGVLYKKLYHYTGKVTYVIGEFYWQVTRNQLTHNIDYQGTGAGAKKRLNREQTDSGDTREVVWSAGETLTAEAVLKAFRLAPDKAAALQRDALPTTFGGASLLARIFFWGFVVIVVLMLFRCASGGGGADCESQRLSYGDASQEYQSCLNNNRGGGGFRTGGGSFGGFSTGGGHK